MITWGALKSCERGYQRAVLSLALWVCTAHLYKTAVVEGRLLVLRRLIRSNFIPGVHFEETSFRGPKMDPEIVLYLLAALRTGQKREAMEDPSYQ